MIELTESRAIFQLVERLETVFIMSSTKMGGGARRARSTDRKTKLLNSLKELGIKTKQNDLIRVTKFGNLTLIQLNVSDGYLLVGKQFYSPVGVTDTRYKYTCDEAEGLYNFLKESRR